MRKKNSENVTKKIIIDQVESSILIDILGVVNNVVSLFTKLCDNSNFTKEIKDKLTNIDEGLENSASQLALDPSSSSNHFVKARFFYRFIGQTTKGGIHD